MSIQFTQNGFRDPQRLIVKDNIVQDKTMWSKWWISDCGSYIVSVDDRGYAIHYCIGGRVPQNIQFALNVKVLPYTGILTIKVENEQ